MTMNAIAIAIGASSSFGNGVPVPQFSITLLDAGAGAVSLAVGMGTGSATFTRATSATCWGPTGLLLTVGSGTARSTYTELTGAVYLGYLSEEARTNNVIQNRDFTQAAWVAGGTPLTAAKDQVGIDGTANAASSLLATGANSTIAQTVTIAAVNRPFSVYVKRLIGTGNIDLAQDGATFTTQTVANDGKYHRVTLVASQLNPALTIRLATNGDKIAVDYASLEDHGGAAVTFSTTPIATTTVAVTRNADALTYPIGNASSAIGSAYAEVANSSSTLVAGNPIIIGNSNNGMAALRVVTGNGFGSVFDSVNAASCTANDLRGTTTVHKLASTWSVAGGLAVYSDGTNKGTNATFGGNMFSGAAIAIGEGNGGTYWNGTVKNVKLWPTVLSDAQVALL